MRLLPADDVVREALTLRHDLRQMRDRVLTLAVRSASNTSLRDTLLDLADTLATKAGYLKTDGRCYSTEAAGRTEHALACAACGDPLLLGSVGNLCWLCIDDADDDEG